MAFLRNFNEESRKIIRSIILMAKNLSIHTLAEGAETKEQVDFLRESGCEDIQGYFYGKPMSIEEFEEKLGEGSYAAEGPLEKVVMDRIGLVNVLTDKPVGLFLNRKDRFVLLLKNDALKQVGDAVYGGGNIYFEGNEVLHSNPLSMDAGPYRRQPGERPGTVGGDHAERLHAEEFHSYTGRQRYALRRYRVDHQYVREK